MKKNKGGRPRIENGERHLFTFKYSKKRRANWERKAKKAGMPLGTWLKKLADEAPG